MNVMPISIRHLAWAVAIFFALIDFGARASAQVLYNLVRIDNPDFIRIGALGSDARIGIFSGDGSERQFSDYRAMTGPTAKPTFIGSYVGSRLAFSGTVNATVGVYNSDGFSIETIVTDPTIRNLNQKPLMNSGRKYPYVN